MIRLLCVMTAAGLLAACAASNPPLDARWDADFAAELRLAARRLASQPHQPPDPTLPQGLSHLNYDQYRAFVFNEDVAPWRKTRLPFELQFFPRGWLFKAPVRIHLIRPDGSVHPLEYSSEQFVNQHHRNLRLPEGLGHAGWRALAFLNRTDRRDELIAFLGASYFRALSAGQHYGSSARGLAIDTATDREEFPTLTEFWIRQPAEGDAALTVFARLDGLSVTGVYRFRISPGATTVVDVEADLFARRDVAKLCLGPITSMFLHGKRSDRSFPDFRPEVHDADGLVIHDAAGRDTWAFRPLNNPRESRVIEHPVRRLRGFGLVQRERDFQAYLDLEAQYHRRPGVWVEPVGEWGEGRVELFELSSDLEYHDNANAYFVPAQPLTAGRSRSLRYRVHWISGDPAELKLAKVAGTWRQPMRQSADGREGPWLPAVRYLIDFAGPELAAMPADEPPQLWVDADVGKVLSARAERNPHLGGWRLVFEIDPMEHRTLNLRAGFARNDRPLTETWIERWNR